MSSGRKATTKTRVPQPMWSWWRWHDRVLTISSYSTLDAAIEHSYATFVRADAYTGSIRMPDETRLHHVDRDGLRAEDQHDTLSEAWDEWLVRHPDQRAEWDTEPRDTRLQTLEQRHVPNPRPFSSESIVANPAWYRRLYGLLGMTDETLDAFLYVHRFAVAEKEARRLAKEQKMETSDTPHRKRWSAAIYLKGYSHDPDYPIVPLETQERACRAYCKRMRYTVHRVYRAMMPPPQNVPLHHEIGIAPGHAFEYFRYASNHPYHAVHNLLDARTIDVIVEFIESGPSRSLYGASLADESSRLLRMEVASLWEIEPPTEDERRLDEVLTQLGKAETEEESSALLDELRTLSQSVKKAERKASSRSVTPTRAGAKVAVVNRKYAMCAALNPLAKAVPSAPTRVHKRPQNVTCRQQHMAGAAPVEHGLAMRAVHTRGNHVKESWSAISGLGTLGSSQRALIRY